MRSLALIAVLVCAGGAALATDSPPESAPAAGPGRDLFAQKCGMCHRSTGMGTGLLSRRYPKGQEQLETRTNLSAAFVSTVVRHGLNNMPALSRAEVSDPQLASIASYLARGNP
jgi:mono/diheme cytochrome c family protein